MAFLPLLVEAKSLARAIHEFQHNTSNRKASRIESTLQKLVDHIAVTETINSPLLNISNKKTRAVASISSRFYDTSWLTDTDKFPAIVAHFEELLANSQVMDSSLQQSIISALSFAVATAVAAIQAK